MISVGSKCRPAMPALVHSSVISVILQRSKFECCMCVNSECSARTPEDFHRDRLNRFVIRDCFVKGNVQARKNAHAAIFLSLVNSQKDAPKRHVVQRVLDGPLLQAVRVETGESKRRTRCVVRGP